MAKVKPKAVLYLCDRKRCGDRCHYNRTSNSNSNIGCRLLEADAGRRTCRVWLNLLLVVRVPHPFYYASLTAQHLLKMSRQDTA